MSLDVQELFGVIAITRTNKTEFILKRSSKMSNFFYLVV